MWIGRFENVTRVNGKAPPILLEVLIFHSLHRCLEVGPCAFQNMFYFPLVSGKCITAGRMLMFMSVFSSFFFLGT